MPSDWKKNGGGTPPGMAVGVRAALRRAGFKAVLVRKNVQYGGFHVVGGPLSTSVLVSWRTSDHMTREETDRERPGWLADYADALERYGYVVERDKTSLTVSKPEKVWTEIRHIRTGELVGWLTKGEFRDVSAGKPSGRIVTGPLSD